MPAPQRLRREDAKNEQLARLLRHRTVVEDGEMAENLAFRIAQRHSQVTFDSQLDQESVFWKVLPYPRGMVAQFAVDHVFTGRARERPLEILSDTVSGPKGDGAGPGTGSGRGELGDEGVVRTDRLCQVTDEGLKKLRAGAVSGPLDDHTECGEFFNDSAGQVVGVVSGSSLLYRFCRSCARLGHRHLPDDEGPSQSKHPPE